MPAKRKKARKIPRKENPPNLEKNTATSFPLINPDPKTLPTKVSITTIT